MVNKFLEEKEINSKIITFCIVILIISMVTIKILYGLNTDHIINAKKESLGEVMSISAIVNDENYVLQRINEKYRNSNIEAYFPVTKYETLNNEVKNLVDSKVVDFKESIKDNVEYSLFINFDMYKFDDYIGFVFHTLEDYAGAHPNTYIFTVNYNIKNDKIINIDTLIEKNNNILNLMSKYAYASLLETDKIKEINMPHMLANGTKAIKSNYKNFVFTKEGLVVFFEKYQIAPYSYGEFWITIPYVEVNLDINE